MDYREVVGWPGYRMNVLGHITNADGVMIQRTGRHNDRIKLSGDGRAVTTAKVADLYRATWHDDWPAPVPDGEVVTVAQWMARMEGRPTGR